MKRRSLLSFLPLLIPFAGCAAETDPDVAEDIFVVLDNETSEQATVAVSVVTGDSVVFEGETAVTPSGRKNVYPGISETGDYTLTISLGDGREQEYPFNIEEYDLQMGSNIIVTINEAEIEFSIQE
ncbi:hypothetical protein Har1130_15190 [Haloarcula sp. CBA1130]|uniref:hypothetical protein n=1 Tax=unclassified Haloarcula TaxID=2624677 RepID=UPI00124845D5|nr:MULTISPECIES: hypothetical protein [unclassified Haloarcula]KAA9395947.1 hypothetical protein Har1129_18730 [Haloarcula sp. CBA1129]KAA9400123.1 hypothetical protein Har1130_15190 [Haloarcula sp. CBA1130]